MIRNALGSLLGLIGAAAAVRSPFRAWYDGRLGRDYRAQELFTVGSTTSPLGDGLAHAYGAGALILLGAAIMRGRPTHPLPPPTPA
ncbi:hypothetical protein [Streptomyces sp. NRRL S-241]|uniref:hypothetical protein n=1 Tax=Streptomyces sp. NRRL S-241 TaxID=1463896 RepID=UPI00068E1EC6|nr:hypothetical protein [Streptomyces sp. NRRL S-241]